MGLYTERARAFGFAATMLLLAALLAVLGVSPRVAAHTPEGYQQTQCGLSPPGNPYTATLECRIDFPMQGDTPTRPFFCEAGCAMEAQWGGGPPQQHKHLFTWIAEFKVWQPGQSPHYVFDYHLPKELSQAYPVLTDSRERPTEWYYSPWTGDS